jgi:hypothetical protein
MDNMANNILEGRPSAGNWSQDILNKHRKIISWTPDCIVLLNGDTTIAGCLECRNKIDFQAFITSVSVNAGVSSGDSSSSIEMSIPSHYGDSIFKDGEFLFSTGVEINVYYRGFFEVEGLSPKGDTYVNGASSEEYDLSKVGMRPYYPVFHGVVTSVSYNFSGGFYSASLSCSGLLHFWQNQKINTNAAYLASTPAESRGSMRLDGHVYTNMTPHQIIYDLYRDSGGSAGDAEWVFSKSSNQKSKNAGGRSLFSQTLRYWENRFSQGLYGLRMYGASGSMFSSLQTAFLGDPSRGKRKGSDLRKIIKGQHNIHYNGKVTKGGELGVAQALGLFESDENARLLRAADLLFAVELDDTGRGGLGMLSTELKAFITDIGALGNVELFSSQFETKQSIADTVAEKVGYEFYQDVDGDLVFKPPFYNMDTSSSRVYRIKREDILDISFEHQEPEYTYAITKGGMFRNTAGLPMEGTWGVKGTYVDYRLVAKYGWKPLEMDTTFFNTARSAFFASVVELEKSNTNVNGCSLSIPMRPELKPGYPVYVEHIDCFYYVTSVSHSFSFGGDCTTGLTLTARRKKFLPPGDPAKDGIDSINLANPLFPPKSLIAKDDEGFYKTVGFPNVVMALDPEHPDPSAIAFGLDMLKGATSGLGSNTRKMYRNMLIKYGLRLGVLKLASNDSKTIGSGETREVDDVTLYKGPWVLTTSDGRELKLKFTKHTVSKKELKDKATGKVTRKAYSRTYTGLLPGEVSLSGALGELNNARRSASKVRKRGRKDARQVNEKIEKAYLEAREKLRGDQAKTDTRASTVGLATIVDLIEAVENKAQTDGSIQKPGSTASILTLLSNKKASFNPNQPGYYRYYSSSSPNPEDQGPRVFRQTEDEQAYLEEERIDSTETNMVLKETEVGGGNRVRFGEGAVVRGLYTRTRYSDNQAVTVPTKDILFLSFQEHGIKRKGTRRITKINGKINGATLYGLILSQLVVHFRKILKGKNLTGKKASASFYKGKAKKSGDFKRVTKVVKKERVVVGDGEIIDALLEYEVAENTALLLVNNLKNDWGGVAFGKNEVMNPNEVRKLLNDVYLKLRVRVSSKGNISYVKKPITYYEDTWKSPIFPVSDEKGYELFGAYQYGRGLNIDQGGGFDRLLRSDVTRLLVEEEVDQFLRALHNKVQGKDRKKIFQDLASTVVKRIEASGGEGKVADAYQRLTGNVLQGENKAESLKSALANGFMDQKNDLVIANTPRRISDIRPQSRGGASCECRGDTSDIEIFLADEGNFLTVASNDLDDNYIVNQYKKEIEEKALDWVVRQEKLKGGS